MKSVFFVLLGPALVFTTIYAQKKSRFGIIFGMTAFCIGAIAVFMNDEDLFSMKALKMLVLGFAILISYGFGHINAKSNWRIGKDSGSH